MSGKNPFLSTHVFSIFLGHALFLLKLFYIAFDEEINRRNTKEERDEC